MAKKMSVRFKDNELQYIRSFYEQERFQLLSRLQHVEQVLSRLDGGKGAITDGMTGLAAPIAAPAVAVVAEEMPKRKPGRPRKTEVVSKPAAKKAGRPKKRGPKSVWGNFIMRRLRQCDRPLSYSELVRDAMVMHNLPASKEKNAKASVLNAAFRLRTHLNKVDTIGLPGKKERFLVLTSWLNAEGGLKAPYDKLFESVAQTPMDDRGRKPRRPSAASRAEAKVKARMEPAAKPAAKKAAAKPAVRKTAAKPAAKKAAAKPAVRKAAAKPAAKKAAAKPAAKKAAAKPAAKKAAAKPAAKKATAKPAAKKSAAKPAAKKPAAKKPSLAEPVTG